MAAALVVIVAAVLFPVFAKAHSPCREPTCPSNLKQLGFAMHQYAEDWDDRFPPLLTNGARADGRPEPRTPWMATLRPYLKNREVLNCLQARHQAVDEYDVNVGYGANRHLLGSQPAATVQGVRRPAETLLVADSAGLESSFALSHGGDQVGLVPGSWIDARHSDGANLLFCDGHVKWLRENPAWSGRPAASGSNSRFYWYPDASR